jgi:hypothetical protein
MQTDITKSQNEEMALQESKKLERRAAMAEIKRQYPGDPEGAREAARLWFEQHAQPVAAGTADPFHLRKLAEKDPQRIDKAAQALRQSEAAAEQAQTTARAAVKEWRKKNPNKVKKLAKAYREGAKTKKDRK